MTALSVAVVYGALRAVNALQRRGGGESGDTREKV